MAGEPSQVSPATPAHPNMMIERTKNWWNRPCGGRAVLVVALPLVVSAASWTVMNFIDRMFLLWHSPQAMAAAMPAGMVHFAILCFPLGIASYVNTFVAQYEGAGRPERIGLAIGQALRVGLVATPLLLATIPLAPYFFAFAGHTAEVRDLEVIYYQVLTFGAGAAVIADALAAFFTGRGETRVVMIVMCSAMLLNIVLDYAWIFGKWGFPAMGIEGAAWATSVAQWFRVLLYWRLMARPVYREKYQLAAWRRYDAEMMRRLLRFGTPNGLQLLLEISAFTVFLLLMGRLGEEAMIATTLAFNVNSIAFVPMLGLGIAVSTMVGQQLGKNRSGLAGRATWTSFWMAVAYMGTMAMLYVAVPDLFLMGHAWGTDPVEFERLRSLTVVLLRFVAAYCLFDAMNLVFVSAIKGAGDTRFILVTTLIMAPLPVLAGWLGIAYGGGGLIWCWWVITVWIMALGCIYFARFLQGRWRRMRVIEPEPNLGEQLPSAEPVDG